MRALFTLTIFVGSALLFLVQPMVAKMILPVFGGTPNVWATAMVFFQAMLLAGYAYAHWSIQWFGARRQPWLQVILLVLGVVALPFALPIGFSPDPDANPAPQVLLLLLGLVGVPFFAVASQAPLIQRWFADTGDPRAKDPYFLYAASNIGSLLALVSYPLLIEPRLRLGEQSKFWTGAYVLLGLLTLASALALARSRRASEPDPIAVTAKPAWKQRLRWVLLAAAPSSLMIGVTTHVTTNIAPVPLLWVVPLGLYLLSYVFAFASKPWIGSRLLAKIASALALAVGLLIALDLLNPLALPIHLLGFFAIAWACHSLLSESRPAADHLTEFFLWLSLGGVLGGAFNALFAPIVFDRVAEYPLAIVLALALMPRRRPTDSRWRWEDLAFPAALVLVLLGAGQVLRTNSNPWDSARLYLLGIAVLAALAFHRPLRLALSVAVLTLIGQNLRFSSSEILFRGRSFFAPMRVSAYGSVHALAHGNILHGQQDTAPERRRDPITYYSADGPIGDVFREFGDVKRLAIVGLGVGTLAAWTEAGQTVSIYEIDPLVIRLATDTRLFSYLTDTPAKLDYRVGDARLRLAEAPDGSYEIIFLDAFSSDAVPVHLLTKEAIKMYLRKLEPGGVLVFNVTNRYLRVDRVLGRAAEELGLAARMRAHWVSDEELAAGTTDSKWLVIARSETELRGLAGEWQRPEHSRRAPSWTDDFSNLSSVFEP